MEAQIGVDFKKVFFVVERNGNDTSKHILFVLQSGSG